MDVNQAKLYDRQIQIFGAHTQTTISSWEVCVCGLNTITTELVKNLALMGFNVALHDGSLLDEQHIAESPLLGACDRASIGQPVAAVVAAKLLDMNPCIRVRVLKGAQVNEKALSETTKLLVMAGQDVETQRAVSQNLDAILVPKFYVFWTNYKYLMLAELPDKPFKLHASTPAQLEAQLRDQHGLTYSFSEPHTPSIDDFPLACVYGSTLNQTILTLVSRGQLVYNTLMLDMQSGDDNPSLHRRLECLILN